MLSPQLRQKVHDLWSLFWTAGIANPLAAIEQITYLLFIRQLENLDRERVQRGKASIYSIPRSIPDKDDPKKIQVIDHEECKWSNIRQNVSFQLFNNTVFPWLRGLEEWLKSQTANGDDRLSQVTGRLNDAYFILDTNKTDTLTKAVHIIDELFRHLDTRSVNADIMGDIFEHLLEEVKESGKNGQFRTPRHVIRFMVELLNPKLETNVLDPACGSGGFLLNTIIHWRAQHTDKEVLKLQWDGTPHNTDKHVWPDGKSIDLNRHFHGYDNDRTMVRIAWMNLILHGLEFPSVSQLDTLSKQLDKFQGENKAGKEFDHILANPPFTGNVDEADLSTNRQRFPAGRGDAPITTKSELLFVWLILDLLKVGGRAAVIVPDGVLFGNTNAHRELRRQLLFSNTLEAVVSLPANIFQPYSGVKTSILIFQRAQLADSKVAAGEPPRTQEVWFYEIEDEAYSLDQKRKERFAKENDFWDALTKFQAWKKYLDGQAESSPQETLATLRQAAISPAYWQPEYWEERWVSVDDDFLKLFPEKSADKGHTFAIHELWSDWSFGPRDPRGVQQLDEQVVSAQRPVIERVFHRVCTQAAKAAVHPSSRQPDRAKMAKASEKAAKDLITRINRLIRDESLLDREFGQFGLNALRPLLDEMRSKASSWSAAIEFPLAVASVADPNLDSAAEQLHPALRGFAKLDGYTVWRRGAEVTEHPGKLRCNDEGKEERKPVAQSWIIPTRMWAKRDTWGEDPETKQEIKKPTHDGDVVRDDYITWLRDTLRIIDSDGTVKEEQLDRLDPDCLESLDFNLSAGRHKPFTFDAGQHRPPAELIGELDAVHAEIRQRLGKLLQLLEGKS